MIELLSTIHRAIRKPKTVLQYAIGVALAAAFLLLIPLFAKLLTTEMQWTFSDFVAAWVLFFSAGLTYRLIARKMGDITYKAAVGIAVATALFLVWSNLAVGLIGGEDNPANWMYMGVVAIGFLGAILARLQPRGMSYVLFTMAFAHLVITIIALIARLDLSPGSSVTEILGVNGFFAVLWIGSALLFRNVTRERSPVSAMPGN